jgi:soluble lytic murein transglycosylase-like protein
MLKLIDTIFIVISTCCTPYFVTNYNDCTITNMFSISQGVAFNTSNFIKYDKYVLESSTKHDIDPDLVRAIIVVESKYNPRAVSYSGAVGLMQLMPETAKHLEVENRLDPQQSIEGGTKYLRELFNRFNDLDLVIAAYNSGPTRVARLQSIPNIHETRKYVKKVKYLYDQFSDQNCY